MGQKHGLVWDSLGFSCLDPWGCCVVAFLCEWPGMQWSPIIWAGDLRISGIGIHDAILDCFLCIFGGFD